MCNWKKWIWPGILATVLLTALAMLMRSGTIEQDLQSKAGDALSVNHPWAQVALDGRDLTLSGVAPSEEAAGEALSLAENAYDVRIAQSDVTLLALADPFTLSAVKDADGKITLTGNVPPDTEIRASIVEAASAANGGAEVVDNLTENRGAPAGYAALGAFGISQLSNLTTGSAEITNSDLTVRGEAPTVAIYNQVTAAVAGELPGDGNLAAQEIVGPTAEPYILAATKSADGIVLEGFVPSDAVRADIVSQAEAVSGGQPITDNMQLALGQPEGFAAIAGFGIGQLADLTTGSASLSNSDLTVRGVAPTVGIYDAVTAALEGDIPGGGNLVSQEVVGPTVDPYTLSATKSADGIVLEGFVPSDAVRADIVARAEAASGGQPVTDNLDLAFGNPEGFEAIADFGISQLTDLTNGAASLSNTELTVTGEAPTVPVYDSVTAALGGEIPGGGALASQDISGPTADPYTLSATKSADGIVLEGFVPSDAVRADIVAQAEAASGGQPVTDNMQLAFGAPEDFRALAGFGISQLDELSNGTASLNNTDLTVTGLANSKEAFNRVQDALAGDIPGGGNVALEQIEEPAVSPYTFAAEKSADGVVLTGFVPDEQTRAAIVARAESVTEGTVTDSLETAPGAQPGFANLAGFGIDRLGEFDTGSASLTDKALTVRGTAATPQSYVAATQALAGSVPANGTIAAQEVIPATVSPYAFTATRTPGVIVLEGLQPSEEARASVAAFATASNPGDRIIDRMQIARGVPEGADWPAWSQYALTQVTALNTGTASLSDTDFSIEGEAADAATRSAVDGVVEGERPDGMNLALKRITIPSVDPYLWTFENPEQGMAKLTGYVPTEELKTEDQDRAVALLGNDVEITNELIIADGAPRGFDGATNIGIQTASRLINGKAAITGTQLVVTGEALSEQAAAAIRSQVENAVPPGFTGTHEITVREVASLPEVAPDECQTLLTSELANNSIRFETNEAVISEESFGLLDRLAFAVKRCPAATVEIEGHTDSDGSESYNQRLSEARANAVRSYLIQNGVFVGRLQAAGYGESRPIADNGTEEGKAQNRRIEFTVVR